MEEAPPAFVWLKIPPAEEPLFPEKVQPVTVATAAPPFMIAPPQPPELPSNVHSIKLGVQSEVRTPPP